MMVSWSGVVKFRGFSFAGLAAFAELFLKRKLSFPVSRMWQRWVRRSSRAVVIFASPNTVAQPRALPATWSAGRNAETEITQLRLALEHEIHVDGCRRQLVGRSSRRRCGASLCYFGIDGSSPLSTAAATAACRVSPDGDASNTNLKPTQPSHRPMSASSTPSTRSSTAQSRSFVSA
jgi:hypothetical protein